MGKFLRQTLQFSQGEKTMCFDIVKEEGFAKVQGDRKALPVKALCRDKHLVVPRAEPRG